MIASTLTGISLDPKTADTAFIANGARVCGNADSNMPKILNSPWFFGLGLKTTPLHVPLDLKLAQQLIAGGAYILGSVDIHIFVIDAVNPANNTIHLRDPDNTCNPDGYWNSNSVPWISNVSGPHYWLYAYAIMKI